MKVSVYMLFSDNHRVCLDRIETTHPLRRVLHVGDRLPLTKGAGGKILLAWMSEKEKQQNGVLDSQIVTTELIKIKQTGFAVSNGEREEGVAAIAAPIFKASGQLTAALSMSGPTVRFTQELIDKMIPHVVKTAKDISSALGYQTTIE